MNLEKTKAELIKDFKDARNKWNYSDDPRDLDTFLDDTLAPLIEKAWDAAQLEEANRTPST